MSIPAPLSPAALEEQIARPVLVQTIEVADPAVLREFARIIAAQEWKGLKRGSVAADVRYRVVVIVEGRERLRLFAGLHGEVWFADCGLQAVEGRGWLRKAWEVALARDAYSPLP